MSGPDAVDLLITGGSLVDGSGSDARPGTVASLGGRLHLGDAAWRPAHAGRERSMPPDTSWHPASSTSIHIPG